MQQWEYKVIDWGLDPRVGQQGIINREAAQGWRLVAAVAVQASLGTSRIYFYFERPKP